MVSRELNTMTIYLYDIFSNKRGLFKCLGKNCWLGRAKVMMKYSSSTEIRKESPYSALWHNFNGGRTLLFFPSKQNSTHASKS